MGLIKAVIVSFAEFSMFSQDGICGAIYPTASKTYEGCLSDAVDQSSFGIHFLRVICGEPILPYVMGVLQLFWSHLRHAGGIFVASLSHLCRIFVVSLSYLCRIFVVSLSYLCRIFVKSLSHLCQYLCLGPPVPRTRGPFGPGLFGRPIFGLGRSYHEKCGP